MKKLINILLLILLFATLVFPQTKELITAAGKNVSYTVATTDSTGTYYSSSINTDGYLPQDLTTNPISFYVSATGTRDSLKVILQGRMRKTDTSTYTTWADIDTLVINFNKVDGKAYNYNLNLNGSHADQIRFAIIGASSVNRANVVANVIVALFKQYGIFQIR